MPRYLLFRAVYGVALKSEKSKRLDFRYLCHDYWIHSRKIEKTVNHVQEKTVSEGLSVKWF